MAAAEDVDVEMVDGLAAVRAGVDDETVPVVEVLLASNVTGRGEQVAEQGGVLGQGFGVRRDVALGDDEHVDGGLRMNVGEGQGVGRFVEARDRDGAANDLAEQAVG